MRSKRGIRMGGGMMPMKSETIPGNLTAPYEWVHNLGRIPEIVDAYYDPDDAAVIAAGLANVGVYPPIPEKIDENTCALSSTLKYQIIMRYR